MELKTCEAAYLTGIGAFIVTHKPYQQTRKTAAGLPGLTGIPSLNPQIIETVLQIVTLNGQDRSGHEKKIINDPKNVVPLCTVDELEQACAEAGKAQPPIPLEKLDEHVMQLLASKDIKDVGRAISYTNGQKAGRLETLNLFGRALLASVASGQIYSQRLQKREDALAAKGESREGKMINLNIPRIIREGKDFVEPLLPKPRKVITPLLLTEPEVETVTEALIELTAEEKRDAFLETQFDILRDNLQTKPRVEFHFLRVLFDEVGSDLSFAQKALILQSAFEEGDFKEGAKATIPDFESRIITLASDEGVTSETIASFRAAAFTKIMDIIDEMAEAGTELAIRQEIVGDDNEALDRLAQRLDHCEQKFIP